ncbi:MAG: DUF6525 family protein [Paracoccaceae bacterium]
MTERLTAPIRALLRQLRRPANRRAAPNAARSSLLGRSGPDPLDEYDALPAPLRQWLAQAAMPWSPRSALRIWRRVLRRSGGDTRLAQREMSRIEAERLAEDVARVWGPDHPYLSLGAQDVRAAGHPRRNSKGPARPRVRRGGPASRR